MREGSDDAFATSIAGIRSRGTLAAPLASQTGDLIARFAGFGFGTDDILAVSSGVGAASIFIIQDGAADVGVAPGRMEFHTTTTAGASAKRMALRQDGTIEVYNTSGGVVASIAPTGIVTLGKAGTQTGTLELVGTTSGTATIKAAAAAGTPTLTTPTVSGQIALFSGANILTVASSAPSSPTTGDLWCDTT